MTSILLAAASALAAWAGMAALCFQSPSQRHRMHLPEQARGARLRFIAAGAALLAISLLAAVGANGQSFGIVLWLGQAGVLGVVLICALPYVVVRVGDSARVAAVAGPLLFVAGSWF